MLVESLSYKTKMEPLVKKYTLFCLTELAKTVTTAWGNFLTVEKISGP